MAALLPKEDLAEVPARSPAAHPLLRRIGSVGKAVLSELAIETFFPADQQTALAVRNAPR
jgi:hypothetical protein